MLMMTTDAREEISVGWFAPSDCRKYACPAGNRLLYVGRVTRIAHHL